MAVVSRKGQLATISEGGKRQRVPVFRGRGEPISKGITCKKSSAAHAQGSGVGSGVL